MDKQQQQKQKQQLAKAGPPLPSQGQSFRSNTGATGPVYEQGPCANRLDSYMLRMKQRPIDNNIQFWKDLVAEFYAPDANMRWCTSAFTKKWQEKGYHFQDNWACRLCEVRPTYGCEGKTEYLANVLKFKYESEIIYENLFLTDTVESQSTSGGFILLTTDKVTHEIMFIDGSLVRKAKLRVVFSQDLKIVLWEFCCWNGEERIPRLVPMDPMYLQNSESYRRRPTISYEAFEVGGLSHLKSRSQSYGRQPTLNYAHAPVVSQQNTFAKNNSIAASANCDVNNSMQTCSAITVDKMKDLMDYSIVHGTSLRESMVKFAEDFRLLHNGNTENQLQPQPMMRLHDTTQMSRPPVLIHSSSTRANTPTTINVTAQPAVAKPYRYSVSKEYGGLQLVKMSTEPIMPQFETQNSSASLTSSSTEANATTTVPSAWVILQPPSLIENQLQQSRCSKMMMSGKNNHPNPNSNPNPSTGVGVEGWISNKNLGINEVPMIARVDEGNSNNSNTSGGGGVADVIPPPPPRHHHPPKDPSSSSVEENIFPVFEPNTSMFLDHIEPNTSMFLDHIEPEEDEYEANLSMFFNPDHSLPPPN